MRKTLKFLFVLFAITIAWAITPPSHAYFAEDVLGDSSVVETEMSVGEWVYAWSPTVLYKKGDVVSWNGKMYKAVRTSMSKEPGKTGSANFWLVQL